MELKMQDEEFLEDVTPLLRPEIEFDPREAYPLVYALGNITVPTTEFNILYQLIGNFGHSDSRFQLRREDSKLTHFLQSSASKWRFVGHYTEEAMWQPIEMLLNFFEIRLLRRKYGVR